MSLKTSFSDSDHTTLSMPSAWRVTVSSNSIECQTAPELYQFEDAEMQTGMGTNIMQSEVSSKFSGKTLLEFLSRTKKKVTSEEWEQRIVSGLVTVDMEVVADPQAIVEEDFFIEFVEYKRDISVQTEPPVIDEATKSGTENNPQLVSFLKRVEPVVSQQLIQNSSSRAFDGYHVSTHFSSAKIRLWNSLSVDLEQRKVLFPDWGRGDFYAGTIVHCSLTRNKERVYDIEYKDSGVYDRINGVRGEYIRVLDESNVRTVGSTGGARAISMLKEGVRVHVKVPGDKKSGPAKYYPARIAAVHRSGTVDVEYNERILSGLTPNDVLLGLESEYKVEARQPTHLQLQCTGVSWTCSGGAVAVSYGRNDITGWCDFPGAVCVWSIFDKSFQPKDPQYVFDHPSCIMCVCFHPTMPSIVAGGSFNGEVVVWNLNEPEKPMCLTAIDSPYTHKEPVLDLKWLYDQGMKKHLLSSIGADGKLLFWDIDNGLRLPIRGVVISKNKEKRSNYPLSHGGTSVAFTCTHATHRIEWALIGQEGGGIARGQMSRINNIPKIAENQAPSDDIYPPMRRAEDSFTHEGHVGPVQTIDSSPFHRYLFLTGGSDGMVRLYHVLERRPLFEWEPSPPPGTPGMSGKLFGAVTAVQFSPVSPVVFASSSSEGFVYFFNLAISTTGPISWVQIPAPNSTSPAKSDGRRGFASSASNRPGVTGIAFNSKQRDMFAATDANGGVHIWKLDWSLANSRATDQNILDALGNIQLNESV